MQKGILPYNSPDRHKQLDFTTRPTFTRQEFKNEADTNWLLKRFGVTVPQRQGAWGREVDYNIDLQQALASITDAKAAYRNLPENLKERYPTWQTLINAVENGQLTIDNTAPPPDIEATPTEPQS